MSRIRPKSFRNKKDSGADLPDRKLIDIHAAFTKVLHSCGATVHFDDLNNKAKDIMTLGPDGATDIASFLIYRLMAILFSFYSSKNLPSF
jgi:hypothetical protein